MDVQLRAEKDTLYVIPHGFIDEYTAHDLRRAMDAAADQYPQTVVLDFGDVDFMDSTGIGVLLGRYKKVKALGGEICVKNLNAQLDKVFRISGLYQIIKAV